MCPSRSGGVGVALDLFVALIASYCLRFWEMCLFSLLASCVATPLGLPLATQMRALARHRVANGRLDCSHDQRNNKLHEQSEVHLVIPATIEASEARLIQPDGTAQAKRSVAWVCFIVTLWMDWTSEPLGMVRGGWGCVGVGVVL